MGVTAEHVLGRCNITYFKHAQERIEAGTAKSFREASRQMAEETGESEEAVRHRVRTGKNQVGGDRPQTLEKELPHVEEKTTEPANAQETKEKPKIRNQTEVWKGVAKGLPKSTSSYYVFYRVCAALRYFTGSNYKGKKIVSF